MTSVVKDNENGLKVNSAVVVYTPNNSHTYIVIILNLHCLETKSGPLQLTLHL